MKVLVLSQYYPPHQTAAGTRMFEFLKALSAEERVERIDIVVWHPLAQSRGKPPTLRKVRVHRPVIGRHVPRPLLSHQDPNPLYWVLWKKIAARYLRKLSPDIVFISTPPGILIAGAAACMSRRVKFIIEYRDNWFEINRSLISQRKGMLKNVAMPLHRLFVRRARHANAKAAFIVLISDAIAGSMGIREDRALVVRNGIDPDEALAAVPDRTLLSDKNIKIAYVGNLSTPYYSPEILIPYIEQDAMYRLIVLSPSRSAAFDAALEKASIAERVKVTQIPHPEMLSVIKACNMGFLSLNEGDPQGKYAVPSKFYDYLACGIPVLAVADPDSFVYRFIRSHGNGIALSWDRTGEIGAALRAIADDPKYSAKAQEILGKVLKEFDRREANRLLVRRILETCGTR